MRLIKFYKAILCKSLILLIHNNVSKLSSIKFGMDLFLTTGILLL